MEQNKVEVREVSSCKDCPFCNNDNEFGRDQCNLNTFILSAKWSELPFNDVHELCPLREKNVLITIKPQQ